MRVLWNRTAVVWLDFGPGDKTGRICSLFIVRQNSYIYITSLDKGAQINPSMAVFGILEGIGWTGRSFFG